MSLLGPPPSRTATFSGTSTSGVFVGPLDADEFMVLTCPGGTASITGSQVVADFEQDLTYGTQGNGGVWGPGATQQWRARVTGGCTYDASGPAGALSSTTDTHVDVGPWIVLHYPNALVGDTSMYPNYGTILDTVAQSASAAFSGSLTLEHYWTSGPVLLRELITAASLSVSFSASASATFYYFDDAHVQQSLAFSYSFSTSWSVSSSPNTVLGSYFCSVSAVTYTTCTWSLTWSLSGTTYSPGSATLNDPHNRIVGPANGPGSTSGSGTVFAGTLTNTTSGPALYSGGWSSAAWSVGPDLCWGADADLLRFRDGAGISGSPLTWTTGPSDPGITVSTDGAGHASGLVWPYDGSTITQHFYRVNGNGPADGTITLPTLPSGLFLKMDPSWADGAGYFLKAGSLGNKAGLLQGKIYRRFQLGTLQLDDSHAFDFFGSTSPWNSVSGSGAFSLDLGGIKYAPSSWPWHVNTLNATKNLKCAFYRYYKVRVRSDQAGAQMTFGVGHRNGGSAAPMLLYYWTITVSAANTWEDHTIDLALPESDSLGTSPMNYVKHPSGWFDNPWGAFDITFTTSGANYWIESFTGFLNQTGSRTPSLLAGSLNAGYPNMLYQHSGSTTSDGPLFANGAVVEREFASAADYSRLGVGGLPVFGRMLVNGVVAADIRPIVNGSYGMTGGGTPTCQTFWGNFLAYWDDASVDPITSANTNDTGLHITATADPRGGYDDLDFSFERSGALVQELSATPGSPVTLDVYSVPAGDWVAAFPGAGDWYTGTYGTRTIQHYYHYLEGQMAGLLARRGGAVRGKTVSFYRNTDTSTLIGTATSNDDGFWRWDAPYGAVKPYSNHPSGAGTSGNPDWQKEFTNVFGGPPTAWNTTALARRFQPFVAKSSAFLDRDGSDFALKPGTATQQLLYSFDRWLTYFGYGDALPGGTGLDLASNPFNWLYRSYLKSTPSGINVGRLAYGGAWVDVQVATDQDGGAIPTLFIANDSTIGVLYHDASGQGRLWWSVDLGATWQDRATWSSVGTFPRAALLPDNTLLVVSYTGSGLTVHQSTDWQTATPPTLSSVTAVSGAPEQLATLRVDRNGVIHFLYDDGTPQLVHSYRDANGAWTTPTVLASGDHAAYALGIERGVYARWTGATPSLEFTGEDYTAASAITPFDLSGLPALDAQYLGLAWDGWETVVVGGIDPATGDPTIFYSPDRHTVTGL
jgi:hypothetical protein